MLKLLVCLLLAAANLIADSCISKLLFGGCSIPRARADMVPQNHINGTDDDYFTGYVQALVDMHYYEFQVRVLAYQGSIYVFNLPRNELISDSILCFIHDIPCVQCVEPVDCCCETFVGGIRACNEEMADAIQYSSAYQSVCETPHRTCTVGGVWFPTNSVLFQPLVADPRQVTNSAALRFNDTVIGQHVGSAMFGNDFIFFRWLDVLRWHGDADIGIEAGIFSVFDLDHPQAGMVNSDFYVSLLLTYAVNKWSWRFRLWHLSSHIGDEYLLQNPGFDRCNVSDNGVDLFVSFQLNPSLRLYLGIGDIIWRDNEFDTQPFYFEWGTEIRVFGYQDRYNRLYVQPFFAMHFLAWEENHFNIDQTYTLGVEWSKLRYIGQKFRIFGEYHNGYCEEGQFVRLKSNYYAIRTEIGF